MKRWMILLLTLTLLLSACGTKPPADLQGLYDTLTAGLPEMLVLDDTLRQNLLGVDSADCSFAITAICADSMRVDEVWVLRAKDTAALGRLTELARARLETQAMACESYDPEQYAVVKQSQLITEGLNLILLITPEADALRKTAEAGLS